MFKIRTKFALIVVMMTLTFLTLTASTYAWFEMNNLVTINDITINVVDGVDLKVSVDKEHYKSTLTYSDLYSILFGIGLEALTTDDGRSFRTFDGSSPAVKEYVEFDLSFRLGGVLAPKNHYSIYLTNYKKDLTYDDLVSGLEKGTAVKSKGEEFENVVEFLYEYNNGVDEYWRNGVYTAYQQEAMRFSFTFNSDDSLKTTIFDLTDNPARGYNYKPNPEYPERDYGSIAYFNAIYPEANLTKNDSGYKVVTGEEFTKFKEHLANDQMVRDALDNNSEICTLMFNEADGYYYGTTTIRIWLEGWDADCFDAILTDKTEIQLEFCYGEVFTEIK